jgi:ATP synthase protein I
LAIAAIIYKFARFRSANQLRARVSSSSFSRPLRTVLKWQVGVTAALAIVAGVLGGAQGALSATLGGLVNVIAGTVYALLLLVGTRGGRARGAGVAMSAMIRAEAGKVLAILGQLWLVLSMYRDIVLAAFFAAFVITVVVFSMAIFVRE